MKIISNIRALYILLVTFSSFYGSYMPLERTRPSKKIFYGSIQFPRNVLNPPALSPIFYKGQQIDIVMPSAEVTPKRGYYEISEEMHQQEFYILITEDLGKPKSNEIMALETSANHAYALFKAIRSTKEAPVLTNTSGTSNTIVEGWIINKIESKEPVIKIPENTIIFFMNPLFVQLADETWHPSDTVYKLPQIVFENTLDEKTLHMTATKLLLSSFLDFRPLHKKIKPIQKTAHNRIISMPGPKNRFVS